MLPGEGVLGLLPVGELTGLGVALLGMLVPEGGLRVTVGAGDCGGPDVGVCGGDSRAPGEF